MRIDKENPLANAQSIVDDSISGIYIPKDNSKTRITNCIIAFNHRGIVTDSSEGKMSITHNCVFENGNEFERVTPGVGNITEDPGFADQDLGDYHLTEDSPCAGAATDGTNLGCF